MFPTLKFEISDQLPEYAGYSDRKFHSDYKKAVETNNYKGTFIFFDAIDRGVGLHSEGSEFLNIIVRIASIIDISLLSENIGHYSPALMYLIIGILAKDKILRLLELYNEENLLPLLMGLRKIVRPDNRTNQDEEPSCNWGFIEKSSEIIDKIAATYKEESLYKYISDSIGYEHGKLWHVFFTAFIARNEKYIADYSLNIDFDYNEFGEYSFDTFLYFGNSDALDNLSTKIFSRFISYVSDKEHRQHPFIFSSYYRYFFHAVPTISEKLCAKYFSGIEEISINLLRSLYSWNLREYEVHYTKLIYWILAIKNFDETCEIDISKLKYASKILEDKRIMNLLKVKIGETVVDFHELKTLLEEPDTINSITLPLRDKAIRLAWSKLEK